MIVKKTKKKKARKLPAVPKKRVAKAKKPKTPRPPEPGLSLVSADLPKTHMVRQQAMADFVSDPESHDPAYHFGRNDREYRKHTVLALFEGWAKEDNWEIRREAYWAEAQRLLLEKTRDNTVQILVDSMDDLNDLRTYALEWCEPIRDSVTKEVLRYPEEDDNGVPHRYAGKPMLAVRPKSFEAGVAAALALDEAVQNRRDEILRLTGMGESASKVSTDPVIAHVNLSASDLREIAKQLTMKRQPELEAHAIHIEAEDHYDEE